MKNLYNIKDNDDKRDAMRSNIIEHIKWTNKEVKNYNNQENDEKREAIEQKLNGHSIDKEVLICFMISGGGCDTGNIHIEANLRYYTIDVVLYSDGKEERIKLFEHDESFNYYMEIAESFNENQ